MNDGRHRQMSIDQQAGRQTYGCTDGGKRRSSFSPLGMRNEESTVSLVCHDPSFCYDGRTVEINTPLESSWSTKLKYISFDFNRGQSDELEQVIYSAARSVNRFL